MTGTSFDGDKRGRWEALLRQFPGSGLSIREFCRRRGISEPSFYAWRRRLRVRNGPSAPGAPGVPLFVPVRVAPTPAVPASASAASSPRVERGRIDVLLGGGVTVRLRGRVHTDRLAAVLEALGRKGGVSC